MNFNTGRGKDYGVEHLLASFSAPLEDILEKHLELSKDRVSFLLFMGSIYVNGRRCLENVHIDEGTYLRIHQNPRRFPIEHFKWPEQKIFEDENLLVVNKAPGLPVPATVDNIRENIASLVAHEMKAPIFVTHRLDMGTSGLLILAKNRPTQTMINRQLQENQIQKLYRALVHGTSVPLGEWLHFMEPSPRAPKTVSLAAHQGWSPCRLRILSQAAVSPEWTEVVIELITGRTHQIRAQLSAAGFPIVGDHAYGSPARLADYEKICLQAFSLEFTSQDFEKKSFFLPKSPWAEASFTQNTRSVD